MAPGGILGALFNGLFMALMAGYLLWTGAMWLFEPVELPTTVLSDTNGVEDLHHVRAWSPTSGRTVFSDAPAGDRRCRHRPGAAGGTTHQFTGPRRGLLHPAGRAGMPVRAWLRRHTDIARRPRSEG